MILICIFPLKEYSDYNHIYTKNLPEIYDMFARWRTTADGFMNR